MTTRQSAGFAVHGELEQGSHLPKPQASPSHGAAASAAGPRRCAWPIGPVRSALAVSATLLALAGCKPGPESPAADAAGTEPARELTVGQSVRGELTTQSAMNMNDGSRYDVLDVRVPADKAVRIALDSAFAGVLALYRDGEMVESSSAASACCGAERRPVALVFQPASAGLYELAVSASDSKGYGPFRLDAQQIDIVNSGVLEAGKTLTGRLGRDTPLRGEHRSNVYDVNIAEAGLYEFTLRSQDFDAYLALVGAGMNLEDDDGAGNLDARITAFLEPGNYSLRAGVLSENGNGVYTVSSAQSALPAGTVLQNGGRLTPGQEIMGSLSGKPVHYEVELSQRSRLVVDMRAEQLDSYLELSGPGVDLSDDDGGNDTNARIDTVLEPGTYRIAASSVSGNGLFHLRANVNEAPAAGGGEIAPGRNVEAFLTSGQPDVYSLRIARAGSYTVTMRAQGTDAFLRLSGNGVQAEDDDGGGDFDARLSVQLAPGTYRLEASSVDGDAGVYTLSVE